MTSRHILILVEREFETSIEETRKTDIYFKRLVYFELCREFTEESLYSIGHNLGKDHATVLHGYKRFKDYTKPEVKGVFMNHYKVYAKLRSELINIVVDYKKIKKPTNVYEIELEEQIKYKYEKKLIEILKEHKKQIEEREEEIKKCQKTINKHKSILKIGSLRDILRLPLSDIEEFDRLAKVFYKRKMHEKKYV